jgi:mannose-1-phosphate guanylyltransferase
MAGGRGERFWPVSREKTPKQLIKLLGDGRPLVPAASRRSAVLPLVPLKNIFIITNAAQAAEVRKQLPKLPKENVVAEPWDATPARRSRLGAALVGARSTTGVMAVLPADHVIPEEKKFQQVLADAFDLAGRGQVIVTIGIKPTEPATGYGYIRWAMNCPRPPARSATRPRSSRPSSSEKPELDKAMEYLNSGQYRWNAGMFVWSFVTVTNGLEKHQPEMFAACQRWFKVPPTSPAEAREGAGEGISRHQEDRSISP